MQIFSTFDHSSYLELAISLLEEKGINHEQIFAIPLNNRVEERKLFDSIHSSDGVSLIDIAMALATAFAVIGASVGFKLALGPIYWGLIGAAVGFIVGFLIRFIYYRVLNRNKRLLRGKYSEIILIVECEESQLGWIEDVLWEHYAIGMAKII